MTLVLSEEDRDFLQHYGVKGMKWGVRRSQAQLDRNAGRQPTRREQRRSRNQEKVSRNSDTRTLKARKRSATGKNWLVGGLKVFGMRTVANNLLGATPVIAGGAEFASKAMSVKVLVNTIQNQRDINRAE